MTKSDDTRPTHLDVIRYDDYVHRACAFCAGGISEGDEVALVPAHSDLGPEFVMAAHPGCAATDGYRLRYADGAVSPAPAEVSKEDLVQVLRAADARDELTYPEMAYAILDALGPLYRHVAAEASGR